jgi:myo-inositol-1(or 4)-monophosphatase
MTDFEKLDNLNLMIQAAEKSATLIRANFRQSHAFEDKASHQDIVTQTDLQSQQSLKDILTQGMIALKYAESEIGFVAEESQQDNLQTHNFIIDPLDGTSNFASGIPHACISVGYAENEEIKIGVVLDPFSETLFWGEKNQGSFLKSKLLGEKTLKLQAKPVQEWMIAAHFNSKDSSVAAKQFEQYKQLYPHIRGLRNIGSLTLDLCWQADNIFDVVLNQGCYFWDLAAASVILREAGGELFDLSGSPLQFDWQNSKQPYAFMSCHPENKAKFEELSK